VRIARRLKAHLGKVHRLVRSAERGGRGENRVRSGQSKSKVLIPNNASAAEPDANQHSSRMSTADQEFKSFISAHFNSDWYLSSYPDVATARIDPVTHWLKDGLIEGRLIAPNVVVRCGADALQSTGDGWRYFEWCGKPISVLVCDPAEAEKFLTFVSTRFDRGWYLKAYPDVKAAKVDPLFHWLFYGIQEGRLPGPDLVVRTGSYATRRTTQVWECFTWRGEPIALKAVRIPESVLQQVRAQARHDPAVLAAGAQALPKLPHFGADDLLSRDGVDMLGIFSALPERPEAIVMIPRLTIGGAEKYAADMVEAFLGAGLKSIVVLVTEQTAEAAGDWTRHAILAPFERARVVFWPDACGPSYYSPTVLARLLNALRPGHVLVVNSRVGLDMVASFGRGLSQFARLYCAYFSLGVDGLGAPYGVRYPRKTGPFAVSLTDNEVMADALRRRYGAIPGPGVRVLPPRAKKLADDVFVERISARRGRVASGSRRWAWVSRIEEFKGTEILKALACLRPDDEFHLFGPLQGKLDALGLDIDNITYRGVIDDLSSADFGAHDGFLFTSLFEGMPNVVLEMSQHAVPMILADVGGLRGTFDDAAVVFVEHCATHEKTAVDFSVALDRVAGLTNAELIDMVTAARHQVLARHSPEAHLLGASNLLGAE
jgi:glycosyltransferase involved in cell wall biosynthesis